MLCGLLLLNDEATEIFLLEMMIDILLSEYFVLAMFDDTDPTHFALHNILLFSFTF